MFTAGEQVFFHDKQFTNDPKHCKGCKAKNAYPWTAKSASRDAHLQLALSVGWKSNPFPSNQRRGRPVLLVDHVFQKVA